MEYTWRTIIRILDHGRRGFEQPDGKIAMWLCMTNAIEDPRHWRENLRRFTTVS